MIIGTCSICGGPVESPDVWHSIIPPVPVCRSCGAVKAMHGPVVEMTPISTPTIQDALRKAREGR